MLIEGLGVKPFFRGGANNERCDLSAAVRDVGLAPFIEGNDYQAATLKRRAGEQWRDIRL